MHTFTIKHLIFPLFLQFLLFLTKNIDKHFKTIFHRFKSQSHVLYAPSLRIWSVQALWGHQPLRCAGSYCRAMLEAVPSPGTDAFPGFRRACLSESSREAFSWIPPCGGWWVGRLFSVGEEVGGRHEASQLSARDDFGLSRRKNHFWYKNLMKFKINGIREQQRRKISETVDGPLDSPITMKIVCKTISDFLSVDAWTLDRRHNWKCRSTSFDYAADSFSRVFRIGDPSSNFFSILIITSVHWTWPAQLRGGYVILNSEDNFALTGILAKFYGQCHVRKLMKASRDAPK